MVSFTLLPLYLRGKSPRRPLEEAVWLTEPLSTLWEKKHMPLPEIEPRLLGRSARSLLTTSTELPRVRFNDAINNSDFTTSSDIRKDMTGASACRERRKPRENISRYSNIAAGLRTDISADINQLTLDLNCSIRI
jgi:hypothetical protein